MTKSASFWRSILLRIPNILPVIESVDFDGSFVSLEMFGIV